MGFIYTISPFIKSDYIPRKDTIASIISDHFYLFNIYDRNPYIVKDYMNFIDANFNLAFSQLGYNIIYYEYPDSLEYNDSSIIEYINNKYNLSNSSKLDICYKVNKEIVRDIVTNQDIPIYFNDYAYYNEVMSQYGIVNFIENDIIDNLLCIIGYLNNDYLKELINSVIIQFTEYQSSIDFIENGASDINEDVMSTAMIVLYQLKTFVNTLLLERSDY